VIDSNTLEITSLREGVSTGKNTMVSADGKSLTSTFTNLGPTAGGEPSVIVYEKQ